MGGAIFGTFWPASQFPRNSPRKEMNTTVSVRNHSRGFIRLLGPRCQVNALSPTCTLLQIRTPHSFPPEVRGSRVYCRETRTRIFYSRCLSNRPFSGR